MEILLVEDNPMDRMFVTQSLRQVEGFVYELVDCESLAEAHQQIVASLYDVILLDLWLPDCEGLETCRRLVDSSDEIPIVVMTGSDDRTLATAAIRIGAQDYLVKGAFPGSAIARVLQYAIDRSCWCHPLPDEPRRRTVRRAIGLQRCQPKGVAKPLHPVVLRGRKVLIHGRIVADEEALERFFPSCPPR